MENVTLKGGLCIHHEDFVLIRRDRQELITTAFIQGKKAALRWAEQHGNKVVIREADIRSCNIAGVLGNYKRGVDNESIGRPVDEDP